MIRNQRLIIGLVLLLITGFGLTSAAQTDSASAPASTKFKNNSSREILDGVQLSE
jgi:hypothetical protein